MITCKPVELGTATEDTKDGGPPVELENPQIIEGYPPL
jgi:hypothetical protein